MKDDELDLTHKIREAWADWEHDVEQYLVDAQRDLEQIRQVRRRLGPRRGPLPGSKLSNVLYCPEKGWREI